MPSPNCQCGSFNFHAEKYRVTGIKDQSNLIVCSECGKVYGVSDSIMIEKLFAEQNEFLGKLAKIVGDYIKNHP